MALTQKERSRRCYENRKNNGLCPRCGKILDRKGHYCSECLEKVNQYRRENKIFYIKNGICPVCGKERLIGDEKQCILCRQKAYERRKPLTDEQKERYGNRLKIQQRELRNERMGQGICPRCGKRKIVKGKKKCQICLDYDAEIHRKRTYKRQNTKEYRKENNLCYHCGEPIDRESGQLCNSCYNKCVDNGKKSGRGNIYWENDNKIIFRKK